MALPEGSGVFLSHISGGNGSGWGSKCHSPRGTAKPSALVSVLGEAASSLDPAGSRQWPGTRRRFCEDQAKPDVRGWLCCPRHHFRALGGASTPAPPLRQSPQEGPGPSDAQWRRGQTRVLQKLRAAGPDPSPIGQHPPPAPAPGLLDQQPEMARGLGGGGEPGGFPSACRKAPVGHATAFRPLSAAKCGSAGGRGCRPELVLRPVAGLGRQPFPPLQGRPGPGRTRPGGRPSVLRGPGHGPGAHTASLPGTSAGQTRKSRPGGRAGGRPRCFLLRRPRPPESIKRGICSASRLPQSGHYAFLSPPLGATYCLLGTWGPEAEPRSGHRLGPGWLFPRGRPVPGGEGESRRQAGWTLGPVSRGCRHKPPRARRRQTAGVCSLTVRSPRPLPGPRSLWSWGSRMSFPSLRDSGHWVWHPP